MKQKIGLTVTAAALVASSAWTGTATASPLPCRASAMQHLRGNMRETVRLRTFYIDAKPTAEVFKIGSKATIDMTVTRPAHEDPLDLGTEFEPPESVPAENVIVGIGIFAGDVFLPGFSRTDANGKATVIFKLPRYMKPGTASMTVYAWNVVHESPCLRIEEDGYASYPEAFEVKP